MDSARKLSFRRAAVVLVVVLLSLVAAGPASSANQNAAPVASFTFAPAAPVTGETVTFTSTSTDSDGQVIYQAWDLDNDGSYDDGTGTTATHKFTAAGTYTVRFVAVDDDWAYRTVSKTVTVKANGAPVASFSASPPDPETSQAVTLTSASTDPDGRALVEEWDLDNDGAFDDKTGRTATVGFPDNGVRKVSLRVTDSAGAVQTTSRDITVRNRPPLASFAVSASAVDTGDPVDFTSTSTDPDGQLRNYQWDFDGDGVVDATGATARHSFADSGTPTVTLTVTDDDGASRSTSRQLTVRNRAPSASFRYAPVAPMAGDEVALTSTSTDPDGAVVDYLWDLDGDGAFDDATGAEVHTTFAAAGSHMVALQVRDDDGAAIASAFTSIEVTKRPDPPVDPTPPATGSNPGATLQKPPATLPHAPDGSLVAPRLLDPFPRVRIHGVTTAGGAKLALLGVRTPGGTRIFVRCKGRGCPWARWVQSARFSSSRMRLVRVPGFSRRHLRAGAVIELFVTREGAIGKYTRLKIRRGLKPPKRVDGCTAPGVARARRCPAR